MESESLKNLRTMRQVKTSLDLAKNQRARTTNSLSRTEEEAAYLLSLNDPRVGQILEAEKKRFAAHEAALDRSRQKVLRAREKLAATINKNRALNELRHELQQTRSEEKNPIPVKARAKVPNRKPKLHQVEVKY